MREALGQIEGVEEDVGFYTRSEVVARRRARGIEPLVKAREKSPKQPPRETGEPFARAGLAVV